MWSKAFWKAATERAVKSAAQALTMVLLVDGTLVDPGTIDWGFGAWAVGAMTVLSYLSSIISAGATDGNPSLTSAEVLDTKGRHAA